MGLAASQGRLLMLTARKSDIEFAIQNINQRRTTLAQQTSQLIRQFSNAMYQTDNNGILNATDINDPSTIQPVGAMPGFLFNDPAVTGVPASPQAAIPTGVYEQQMALVQSLDKELELRTRELDTQHKAVETEYDAVKKVIDKNIETSFKTLG